MNRPDGAPLAVRFRGERPESVHLGHLVILDVHGHVLLARGDAHAPIFARSALKPVQALPLFLSGAAEAFGLPDEALAVALASHSGDLSHQAAVQCLLDLAGLDARDLQCGTHPPYDESTALALALRQLPPTVLHCNCSGKHAAMLAVCRHKGWDLLTYRERAHPLQQWIHALLAELTGLDGAQIADAIDGCGVPVWHLPLSGLARAFARLGTPAVLRGELRQAAQRIAGLMADRPALIAGTGRFDTDLLAMTGDRLIAKIGGEGVHVGAVRGTSLGWAIKVADGNKRALGPALARALAEIGHPLPAGEPLCAHTSPVVYNNRREVVGRLEAGW
jgi:L-asparaginase II